MVRAGKLLVIRRSATVVAPLAYCFPGGGIEGDESEEAALVRELREELNVEVQPLCRLWQSETPWEVELAWWMAELPPHVEPLPNPHEVHSCAWQSIEEMLALEGLLDSNRQFLAALERGEFRLEGRPPSAADGTAD
ncbi:MAG: NUDIX domain-containing protein [Planctomycetaceae bacterium]|nr:NUDIX domain-containing protein [Planctomycetaceae bacterium]